MSYISHIIIWNSSSHVCYGTLNETDYIYRMLDKLSISLLLIDDDRNEEMLIKWII